MRMEKFDLKNKLDYYYELDAEAWGDLESVLIKLSLSSKEYFLKENEICRHIAFLSSGYLRAYKWDDKGEDKTIYFNFIEKAPIVSNFTSFINQTPSTTNIQAITDCEMLMVTRKDLYQLYDKHSAIDRIGRLMAEQNYLWALERIEAFQSKQAKERYKDWIEKYPQLIRNIPDKYIASCLGVTNTSFSRLKKDALK